MSGPRVTVELPEPDSYETGVDGTIAPRWDGAALLSGPVVAWPVATVIHSYRGNSAIDPVAVEYAGRVLLAAAAAMREGRKAAPSCCTKSPEGRHAATCYQRCWECGGAPDGPDQCEHAAEVTR